ncbi:MAG TPA: helix-turn-helix domain-containing protein [Dehalococcoidia bacterium]|nr:helix-turn-helix domain-containing protein [Dehalococcoidia bacterium]
MLSQLSADPAKNLLYLLNDAASEECRRLNSQEYTLDIQFLAFLRSTSQFGFFSFGPVHINVRLIEDIVERTTPRRLTPNEGPPPYSDDYVRFSQRLLEEVRRSGRSRIDDLHFLLAFMRTGEGLPARVFGELGVTPEQVEQFARDRSAAPAMEKLFSPEEAAEYLNVHVQTVRSWIKSGRLKARRLAGQRALRITASDLMSVLEPVDPADVG